MVNKRLMLRIEPAHARQIVNKFTLCARSIAALTKG